MLRAKKKKPGFIDRFPEGNNQLISYDKESGLSFLVSFFGEIRPTSRHGKKDAEKNIQHLIAQLYEKPVLLQHLQRALLSQPGMIIFSLIPAFAFEGLFREQ